MSNSPLPISRLGATDLRAPEDRRPVCTENDQAIPGSIGYYACSKSEGGKEAVRADDAVVAASEVRRL
jgi:hypothetical protein